MRRRWARLLRDDLGDSIVRTHDVVWTYLSGTRRPHSWQESVAREPIELEEHQPQEVGRLHGAEALEETGDVPEPPWCKYAGTATATTTATRVSKVVVSVFRRDWAVTGRARTEPTDAVVPLLEMLAPVTNRAGSSWGAGAVDLVMKAGKGRASIRGGRRKNAVFQELPATQTPLTHG